MPPPGDLAAVNLLCSTIAPRDRAHECARARAHTHEDRIGSEMRRTRSVTPTEGPCLLEEK